MNILKLIKDWWVYETEDCDKGGKNHDLQCIGFNNVCQLYVCRRCKDRFEKFIPHY